MPNDPGLEELPQPSAPSREEMHARMQEVIAEIRRSNRAAREVDGPVGRQRPRAERDRPDPPRR